MPPNLSVKQLSKFPCQRVLEASAWSPKPMTKWHFQRRAAALMRFLPASPCSAGNFAARRRGLGHR